MSFEELVQLLGERLRQRVRNGEFTERGLARMTGLSQPHVHNMLKGERRISLDVADLLMRHLHFSVLDLIGPERMSRHLAVPEQSRHAYVHLPVLTGKLGPNDPWPSRLSSSERFGVQPSTLAGMVSPVVVRAATDPDMLPTFAEDDHLLLDQSIQARTHIQDFGYYAIKRGTTGLIRKLRVSHGILAVVSEKNQQDPDAWELIPLRDIALPHLVRARVTFISADLDWKQDLPA